MTDDRLRPLRLETPHAENRRLREENARLRQLLAAHGIPIPSSSIDSRPSDRASGAVPTDDREEQARQRIALFRGLFRGREDVYARRWESADGRAGYAPAALKDWQAINRSRPEERKQVDLATRTLLPLTDAVLEAHLMGRETIGVYPLLVDETCWFLAVDFDKQTWAEDARAFLETCQECHVPAALERSRSGNGGHVWISSIARCRRQSRVSSGASC